MMGNTLAIPLAIALIGWILVIYNRAMDKKEQQTRKHPPAAWPRSSDS